MEQTPASPEDPAFIKSIAQEVLYLTSERVEERHDDLLQASAMVYALRKIGLETRVDVMDTCFEDSTYEGSRVFGFLLGNEPCDIHGNMGWDKIIQEYIDLSPLTRNREWFMDENCDASFIITDEISQRDNVFFARVEQVGGGALANIEARQLKSGSSSAPPSKIRRIGL